MVALVFGLPVRRHDGVGCWVFDDPLGDMMAWVVGCFGYPLGEMRAWVLSVLTIR